MRVEITEQKLSDAGYNLVEGDIITVPNEIGAAWCGYGWAKDTAGVVATGERIPGVKPIELEVQDATMGLNAEVSRG